MYVLYGTPLSNYYNKVKLCLLEMGLPFQEQLEFPKRNWPQGGSPSGKIPYLQCEDNTFLFESQAIVEYLCAKHQSSLLPSDLVQAAQIREVLFYIELYLEAPMKTLYPMAYWGKPIDSELCLSVLDQVKQGLAVILSRARCQPYLLNTEFSLVDVVAWVHFKTIQHALKVLGLEDIFMDTPISSYLAFCAQRPTIQRLEADKRLAARA